MNFLTILILSVVLLGIAMAGFAVKILLQKGGKFPNTHVSGNKYLKSQGISCIQSYDKSEQTKARQEVDFKNLKVTS